MKTLWFPLSVLGLILALSLWNGSVIDRYTSAWIADIRQAEEAAKAGDWEQVDDLLRSVYAEWDSKQTYLHMVEVHGELSEAETAFLCAIACVPFEDETEFICETQELLAQLRVLAEMEKLSIKNVL